MLMSLTLLFFCYNSALFIFSWINSSCSPSVNIVGYTPDENFHLISHLTVSFQINRHRWRENCLISKKRNKTKTSQKVQGSWRCNDFFFFKHFKIPFGLNIPNTGFADFSRPDETSSFTFFQNKFHSLCFTYISYFLPPSERALNAETYSIWTCIIWAVKI